MPRFIDLAGRRYGRWTVIEHAGSDGKGARWLCLCDCGTLAFIYGQHLREGNSRSCGCGRRTKGGLSRTPMYQRWKGMIARCHDPNNHGFPNYGGRGIVVCERWQSSFEAFMADMGDPPSPEHTLDRIDNDGPYSPENCRWATNAEQGKNRRTTQLVTFRGVTLCISDWARMLGVSYQALQKRLNRQGLSVEEAFTTPVNGRPLNEVPPQVAGD